MNDVNQAVNLLQHLFNNPMEGVEKRLAKVYVPKSGCFCDHLEHKLKNVPRCYVVGKKVGTNKNGKFLFVNLFFFKLKAHDLGKEIICDCEIVKSTVKDHNFYHLRLTKLSARPIDPQNLWNLEVRDEFMKTKNSFPLPQFGRTKIVFLKNNEVAVETTETKIPEKKETVMAEKIFEAKIIKQPEQPKKEGSMNKINLLTKTTKKAVNSVCLLSIIDDDKKITVNFGGDSFTGFFVEEALILVPNDFSNKACYKAMFFEATTAENKTISGVELVKYNCEKNATVSRTSKTIKIVGKMSANHHPEKFPIVGTNKVMVLS